MSNNYFQFKQFLVNQENVSMRVNTDGVLLGAWATLPSNATGILDVGTGTGVIALMTAQRLGFQQPHCQIVAIDVDNASCKQAQENFQQSKWSESLVAKHISLQDFNTEKLFDLIISNPPYFNNALKNPSEAKRTARHTDTLSYQDLTDAASKLLKPNGRLSVIIPFDEYPTMQSAIIATNKLRLSRLCKVFTLRQDPAPKRLLLEFTKEQRNSRVNPNKEFVTGGTAGTQTNPAVQEEALCIMENPSTFTSAYKSLTKDFYLKF